MALRFFVVGTLAALATFTAFSAQNERVEASATAAATLPAAPTLVLGQSTLPADATTTITWNATNAADCTAGGNANALQSGWHGVLSISGTYTVTPINVGTYVYSLYCTNATGNSPTASATLTVTPSPYVGNVGSLDPCSLVGLALCVVLLRHRMMRGSDGESPPAA